ncbi:MAG: chromosome segregation protein SMC [Planctomycetota bacterium]|nr:MAG: chromosome segregation protein SMC [Planctomycetota bacterium]
MHNEIIRLNTHRESLVGQKGRLSERDAQIASELSEALEQKTSLGTRVRELDRLIEAQTAKLEEKRGEAARLEDIDKRLTEELAHAKERRSALASRADVLRDLQERRDGVAASVQRILDARDRGLHPELTRHVAGVTADLFDADLTHARVVEAVLGDAAQYLVITDSRAFLRAFGVMGELPGRLTAVALDRLPPVVNPRDFSEVRGFVAPALDLVRYDDRFETLARHLFGKTVVVETLEDALAAAADDVHGHRFVTRKGDVVEPDGRVVLASSKAGGGILSRRSELRDIESTLADLDARIESLKDRLNRTQAERAHLDGVLQELRTAIYEANTAKVEARAGLATVEETVRRLTQEQPVIAQEVALLEQQIQEVHARSEEGGKSLEAIERENKEREALIHRRQEEIDALVEQRKQVQAELTEARVEAGQLSEKRTAARERIGVLTRAVDDLQSALTASRHDQEQCEARIAEAQREAETGRTHLEEFKKSLDALQERCGTLRRQREELRRESEQLGEAVKTLRQRLEQAEADHHQVQMQLAETNVREEELLRHTEEELGIDLKARYAEYEHEEQDWAAVEAEMEELRGKIARLGNVNLDAISELEELEERHGFLSTQRDDLTESRRQLERLIEKLDHEARERFQKTFEEIRQNFRALFRKLFGGGRADVVLEDPEQVLECGIEILAQPPGKELQSISLMSGGEKSMTAIALLMSIFRSRPAPCTFLDEVDAALDEANNDRFNRIVREFVHDTQFVIVTHSKWTMNMADRLYGVTMQEPGVSTLVSVELEGAEVA